MNKTIYLRDEEGPIWERARELAGDKLSPVIVTALKQFIAAKEAESKGFERIEVAFNDSEEHGIPKKKAFYGKWVFPPSTPEGYYDDENDTKYSCAVALTAKGNVVFYSWKSDSEHRWADRFTVRESLADAAADPQLNWAARAAIDALGVQVEELDI